jgi:hypothetical protein
MPGTGHRPERLRYGTFDLGSETPGGIVHLRSALPEIVAIGHDALMEMRMGVWPLGGPHCDVQPPSEMGDAARLHVVTPECEFTYELVSTQRDSAGWYFLFRRVYVSTAYHTFAEALRG